MGSGPISDKTVSSQYNKTQVKKLLDLLAVEISTNYQANQKKEGNDRKTNITFLLPIQKVMRLKIKQSVQNSGNKSGVLGKSGRESV